MFCPECGYKNVEGAAFCENCGTKLTGMPGSINQKETSYEKTGEKTTKKSVPFGKINKMLLIEIPIAMISLLIFIMVFQAKFSVKSVVERYVEGMGDGNWNQVMIHFILMIPETLCQSRHLLLPRLSME